MRVIALDIGDKRTGIAYGTTRECVALPIDVISTVDVVNNGKAFQEIIDDYMPDKLLIGLPKSLNGQQNKQAKHIKEIAKNLNINYEFTDERLSSAQAKTYLRELGLSEREMRGKIDKIAASLFLESWFRAKVLNINKN